jgi:hypothetical protein
VKKDYRNEKEAKSLYGLEKPLEKKYGALQRETIAKSTQ